jgi:hypothetical protein
VVKPLSKILATLLLGSGAAAGCGGSGNSETPDSGLVVVTPDSSLGTFGGDDGSAGDGQAILQGMLAVTPTTATVTVTTGQAIMPVQFTATVGNVQTAVGWGVDRGEIGMINSSGLFTPSGNIGGTATITAVYGSQKVTTTVTVNILTVQQGDPAYSPIPDGGTAPEAGAGGYGGVGGDGPGPAPMPSQMTTLASTPMADSAVSILYPYNGTVWPQGLLAPLLQWNAGSHAFDSVYVDLKEKSYEYQGYFAANAATFQNLPIPEAAWDAATLSNGGEPLVITLVFGQGANAYGPYTESWTIAQAELQGTIYYNSYGTGLVQNSDSNDHYNQQYGAGTLAIKTGATAPVLVAGVPSPGTGTGCRVCHTVSADGQSLVTQASNGNASNYADTRFLDLSMDTTMGAGTSTMTQNLAFPAYYRDGSLLFSGAGGMINGDTASQLYAMPAGTLVAGVTGLSKNFQGTLPSFSPDGKHVSFNFWSGSLTSAANADGGTTAVNGDQVSLALLDFDGTSAFTNPRTVYTPASGRAVTYSSFLPNSAGVVFEVELANNSGQWGYTWKKNTGELWWLDTASGMAHRLDQLNGYTSSGDVYLPGNAGGANTHPTAQEVTLNYEPTVNPIASGGYAWVVFTSRRMYGNVAQLDPWTSDPRLYAWKDPGQITDKKLWVAAVDLNAPAGTDPSHPAFYLPAQELRAGNSRGYWSVDACKANGMSCQAGDQCCGGYCQPNGADGGLICSSTMPQCSAMYDKCTMNSDCCGAPDVTCINSVCTVSQPPAK